MELVKYLYSGDKSCSLKSVQLEAIMEGHSAVEMEGRGVRGGGRRGKEGEKRYLTSINKRRRHGILRGIRIALARWIPSRPGASDAAQEPRPDARRRCHAQTHIHAYEM